MGGRLGRLAGIVAAGALLAVAIVLLVRADDIERALRPGDDAPRRAPERPPGEEAPAARGFLDPPARAFRRLVGREVRARGAIVESVPGPAGFWIGPGRAERVFVRVTRGEPSPARADERVDVDGEIVRAGDGTARELGLGARDAAAMRRVGAYIDARRVRVVP